MPLLATVRDSAGLCDRDGAAPAGHVNRLDGGETSARLGQADAQHIKCGSGQIERLTEPMTVTADARCPYEDGALQGAGRDFKTVRAPYHRDLTPKTAPIVLGIPTTESRQPFQPIRFRRSLAGSSPSRRSRSSPTTFPSSNCRLDRTNHRICRKNVAFCATDIGTSRPQLVFGALPAALAADGLALAGLFRKCGRPGTP
jgi:hypothetical protein